MKKILALVIAGLFACSMVFAKDSVTRSDSAAGKDLTIHSLKITNSSYGTRVFYPTLKLGTTQNGICLFNIYETIPSFTLASNFYTYFNIWGDAIAQKYGLFYNCAQLTVQTSAGQYAHDDFYLSHNGYIYTYANPNYAETFFNAR